MYRLNTFEFVERRIKKTSRFTGSNGKDTVIAIIVDPLASNVYPVKTLLAFGEVGEEVRSWWRPKEKDLKHGLESW